MVCAPAGSGKTTAMLYWAEELRKTGRPVLWLAARAGISDMPSFLLALEAAGVAAGLGWQGAGNSISAQDWLAEFASNGAGRPGLIIDDAPILQKDVMHVLSQLTASARVAHPTILA